MTRQEAQDYERRFRDMVIENGVEWLIDLVDYEKVRKLAICTDYKKYSSTVVARLHTTNDRPVSRCRVAQMCGKKIA